MIGVEAAIILIAFVITAAAFSFMVVNMGLFATQRGRDTISQGLQEASTPLMLDGNIMIRGVDPTKINAIIVPLKTLGVKYVPMSGETTVVELRIGKKVAYANIYEGIDPTDPTGETYDALLSLKNITVVEGETPQNVQYDDTNYNLTGTLQHTPVVPCSVTIHVFNQTDVGPEEVATVNFDESGTGTLETGTVTISKASINYTTGDWYITFSGTPNLNNPSAKADYKYMKTGASMFVENSNGDDSLNSQEKGYLLITLKPGEEAAKREPIFIEIRPEKGAPLSVEFTVPSELEKGWQSVG